MQRRSPTPRVFSFLLAALLGLSFAAPRARAASVAPAVRLVRITLDARVTLPAILGAGLDVASVHGDQALVYVREVDAAALAALGAHVETLDADPGATAARRAAAEIAGRARPTPARVLSAVRSDGRFRLESLAPFGSGSMGGYWTLDEVKMKLDSLVASDTNQVVADKVDTLGYTAQGRPIWGLAIGRARVGPDARPWVYYNALTHAREPGGMQSLFWFVDDLLSGYGSDPWKTYLLENRRLYLCPVVNPDGYAVNQNTYTTSGGTSFGLWRKNCRDNDSSGTFNTSADGVDINRNYPYQWGLDNVGSSSTRSSDIYRGTLPASERETQAQMNQIEALQPKTALSFHTYSDLWLHPWGYTATATSDSNAFYEWDDEAQVGVGYMSGQSTRVLYSVNGEFNDWCYGEIGAKPRIYSWTPEAGSENDGFWPPPSRIVPIANDNLRGCYFVAALAGPYVRVDHADWSGGSLLIGAVGSVQVTARNLGLAATSSGLNATLVSLEPGVEVWTSALSYPTLASRTSAAANGGAAFTVATADTLTPGRLLRFRVEFRDDAGLFCRDTLEIPAGQPTFLVDDPSNATTGWTVGGSWGIVSNNAIHPSRFFADSPAGKYPANYNASFVLKNRLDLHTGVHAWAYLDAMWSFEGDYDGCLVEASLDSVTWTPLWGRASTPGTLTPQPAGKPIYESQRHLWRFERIDLSPFAGPTATAVRFRFRSLSDGGTQFDGMNFDSLRIALYDPAAQPTPVAVAPASAGGLELAVPTPNPAGGSATFAWTLPRAGHARLDLLDLSGRRVVTLADGAYGANRYVRAWDLRDDRGRRVEPGVYFARLVTDAGARLQRLVVLR